MGKKSFAHLTAKDAAFYLKRWMNGGLERRDITWHLDVENLLLGWDISDRWRQVERYDDGWFNHIRHITDIELGTLHELSLTFERSGMTGEQMREYLKRDIFCPKLRAHIRGEADLAPLLVLDTSKYYETQYGLRTIYNNNIGTIPLRASSFRHVSLRNERYRIHNDFDGKAIPGFEEHNQAAIERASTWLAKRKTRLANQSAINFFALEEFAPNSMSQRTLWGGTHIEEDGAVCYSITRAEQKYPRVWIDEEIYPPELALPTLIYKKKGGEWEKTDSYNFDIAFALYAPHLLQ